MTETVISSATKTVVIGFDRPFTVIGERINPTGRKRLAAEMADGDYSRVESDTLAQVTAGPTCSTSTPACRSPTSRRSSMTASSSCSR